MPPKRKQKTAKEKKEDAERQKKILSTKEKILAIKRMLLSIIETMIEKDVKKEWFLSNCTKLCHADYNDVVQERSIENLCGYPLCSNVIKETVKQKYRISHVTKKVYDLTERKCFCSNQCYKASNYLRAQLSPIPLYMRKEEKIKAHLLSNCDNRGSAGEEIVFHHTISQDEIYKVYNEEDNSSVLQNMLNEDVKKCADSLGELQIKEHVYEKQYVFGDETSKKSGDAMCKDKSESASDIDVDSDDSLDEKLFPSYDNLTVLSHRHMPIPEKIRKSFLIPPLKAETNTCSPVKELSLDFIINVFKDWMTEDTLKYLMGEKYVYGIKADHLFERMTEYDNSNSEKLSSIKKDYIQLCLKIDSLPDDDDIGDSLELDVISESNTKNTSLKVENENNSVRKVFKRRPRKSKEKSKHVTFASETMKVESSVEKKVESPAKDKVVPSPQEKNEFGAEQPIEKNVKPPIEEQIDPQVVKKSESPDKEKVEPQVDETEEESPIKSSVPEPGFPLVDSVSQNILRRQILIGKVKSVYTELLPVAGLHYTDIRKAVKKFVDSLSLTPTNIIFKPKEWKLISLVLFRVLTRTVLKDIHDELQFAKLCEDPLLPIAVDLREIEKLVCDIVSAENIINLH